MKRISTPLGRAWIAALVLTVGRPEVRAQADDSVTSAQAYRQAGQPVRSISETTIVCEAEEFQVARPGWVAQPWGSNYYASTFANTFLSRKAFLGAPEQCDRSEATTEVQVPKAGRYLALVRYEAVYRFETKFRLQVEQGGKTLLDRPYGGRDNLKIWAFGAKLKKKHAWPWGAVENLVWEGHDAFVDLQAGKARLMLVADKQTGLAARRNVDLVMLTTDEAQVKMRIDKENYLPLDGMLTQADDVYLKLHNDPSSTPLTLTVPNGTEHSPYWLHIRTWTPKTLSAGPGQSTAWVEVGSLLDSLDDGQWLLTAKGAGAIRFHLEFGVKTADGTIKTFRRFENRTGDVARRGNRLINPLMVEGTAARKLRDGEPRPTGDSAADQFRASLVDRGKIYHRNPSGPEEMYDRDDAGEERDLVRRPESSSMLESLRDRVNDLLRGDRLRRGHPPGTTRQLRALRMRWTWAPAVKARAEPVRA